MTTLQTLKSEVEINRILICVNDVLFYLDEYNTQKWVVTELFKGGFEAIGEDETQSFYFSELQKGWVISSKTKEDHKIYDRHIYN